MSALCKRRSPWSTRRTGSTWAIKASKSPSTFPNLTRGGPSSAVLLEADREWHKLYESLAGVEPPRKLLGIHRTLRIFAAVSLGTVLLSTWLCCMGTRVAHWIVFAFPLAPQKTRDEKGGSVKACGFPPPNEDDFKPSDAAFVRSTTFSASARSLSALLSREVAELNLGTKTGDMALRIVLQPAMPTGFVATVELVNAQDQGMPVASCRSEDGSTQFKISDTAGTFTGTLGPLEGRGQPAGVCRFRLVREGRGDTVLTIEGPADGRPTPGSSPLIAKTAYDGVLGSLILDEDDVEVTLMHSAMDSVVLVALMGLCLLKQ